ncbi:MAG: class II glutamine amidotransferase [Archaeoglobaceae archaeon]
MCELFALSCNSKDRGTFSLPLFARYHTRYWHGWGIGYYEDGKAVVKKSTKDPNSSEIFRKAVENARSNVILAHLRLATRGEVCEKNCHPFRFGFLNRDWLFAHNGDLPINYPSKVESNTDSAMAFSFMIDKIVEYLRRSRFRGIYPAVKLATKTLLESYNGTLNYLLTDGNALFAFCNHRNMFMLRREKDYGGAILISTQKLTDERWVPIPKNRIICLINGELFVVSKEICLRE